MNESFLSALRRGGLVGDGAMGSQLYERGVYVNRSFDEVVLSQPELVYRVHREYLDSGAQVLETNTYGANRLRLGRHGLAEQTSAINEAAVALARRACGKAAYVAGSMGPVGIEPAALGAQARLCTVAFAEQAEILQRVGCDLIILETFAHIAELELCVRAVRTAVQVPVVALVAPDKDGNLDGGMAPARFAAQCRAWGVDVVGVNCSGPAAILKAAGAMVDAGLPVCAMPNAGLPEHIDDRLIYLATPENFGVYARRLYKAGVKWVGGCCGTSAQHIARVSAASRMIAPRLDGVAPPEAAPEARKPTVHVAQRSPFGALLGKKFVVSVEVNPHPGLDVEAPLQAAKMLRAAGADVINIADGPRATVRMSNLALAEQMRARLGIDVLLHVCCRDHNLLGLQSLLLGAHVMGIRNLVVITGDPPKIGDYPDATAVYDVDSIGLLKLLDGFNHGIDPAGKGMPQTKFLLATGVEPGAKDFDREMLRLRQKVAAGANLIMTQPVYDPAHLTRYFEAAHDLNVPTLVGLLPLASARNAEFVHHNIPGMRIPDAIRDRMRRAGKGEAARREGVRIAAEALQGVRDQAAGAYIMPPLGRYEMAAQLIEALGPDRSLATRPSSAYEGCSG